RAPSSTLFTYTTLFRSEQRGEAYHARDGEDRRAEQDREQTHADRADHRERGLDLGDPIAVVVDRLDLGPRGERGREGAEAGGVALGGGARARLDRARQAPLAALRDQLREAREGELEAAPRLFRRDLGHLFEPGRAGELGGERAPRFRVAAGREIDHEPRVAAPLRHRAREVAADQ